MMNTDDMYYQLNRLKARHQQLKARIGQELSRPKPDALILQKLKRLRLKTKDGIARLMRSMNPGEQPAVTRAA